MWHGTFLFNHDRIYAKFIHTIGFNYLIMILFHFFIFINLQKTTSKKSRILENLWNFSIQIVWAPCTIIELNSWHFDAWYTMYKPNRFKTLVKSWIWVQTWGLYSHHPCPSKFIPLTAVIEKQELWYLMYVSWNLCTFMLFHSSVLFQSFVAFPFICAVPILCAVLILYAVPFFMLGIVLLVLYCFIHLCCSNPLHYSIHLCCFNLLCCSIFICSFIHLWFSVHSNHSCYSNHPRFFGHATLFRSMLLLFRARLLYFRSRLLYSLTFQSQSIPLLYLFLCFHQLPWSVAILCSFISQKIRCVKKKRNHIPLKIDLGEEGRVLIFRSELPFTFFLLVFIIIQNVPLNGLNSLQDLILIVEFCYIFVIFFTFLI